MTSEDEETAQVFRYHTRQIDDASSAMQRELRGAWEAIGQRHGALMDGYGAREIRIAEDRLQEALMWAVAGLEKAAT